MNADIGRSIIEQEQAENRRLRALIQTMQCEHDEEARAWLHRETELQKLIVRLADETASASKQTTVKIHECKALRNEIARMKASYDEEISEFNQGVDAAANGSIDDEPSGLHHDVWRCGFAWVRLTACVLSASACGARLKSLPPPVRNSVLTTARHATNSPRWQRSCGGYMTRTLIKSACKAGRREQRQRRGRARLIAARRRTPSSIARGPSTGSR